MIISIFFYLFEVQSYALSVLRHCILQLKNNKHSFNPFIYRLFNIKYNIFRSVHITTLLLDVLYQVLKNIVAFE